MKQRRSPACAEQCPEVVCNIVSDREGKGRDIKYIPLGDVTWVHSRSRRGDVVDRCCRRQRCHRGTGGSGTGSGWTFIIIGEHPCLVATNHEFDVHANHCAQAFCRLLAFDDSGCRVRFVCFFVQPHDICAKHWRYFDCLDLRRFEPRVISQLLLRPEHSHTLVSREECNA